MLLSWDMRNRNRFQSMTTTSQRYTSRGTTRTIPRLSEYGVAVLITMHIEEFYKEQYSGYLNEAAVCRGSSEAFAESPREHIFRE